MKSTKPLGGAPVTTCGGDRTGTRDHGSGRLRSSWTVAQLKTTRALRRDDLGDEVDVDAGFVDRGDGTQLVGMQADGGINRGVSRVAVVGGVVGDEAK